MVGDNSDDGLIAETLGSTDVILSLNKKQRWRLPAEVNNMILGGKYEADDTKVSVIERHKLQRRANCVRFSCNRSRFNQKSSKPDRYFCFNADTIDVEKSNRKLKREKAAVLKRKSKAERSKKVNETIQTLELFTRSGKDDSRLVKPLTSSTPEYRLEVFYPCPKSCSLAFNPKYTDVKGEVNEDGTKGGVTKQKKRKRTVKNYGLMVRDDLQEIEDDVAAMWLENDESLDDLIINEENELFEEENYEKSGQCIEDKGIFASNGNVNFNDSFSLSGNLLANLITEAQLANRLCSKKKLPKSKKKSNFEDGLKMNTKGQVIFTSDRKPKQFRYRSNKPRPPKLRRKAPEVAGNEIKFHHARVIILGSEVSVEELRAKFGSMYHEADCQPRRFLIDVSSDIFSLLTDSRACRSSNEFTSYIMFTYDGVYDEDYAIFKVQFNSILCTDSSGVVKAIPFQKQEVETVMGYVVSVLLDMKYNDILDIKVPSVKITSQVEVMNLVMNLNVSSFSTSEKVSSNILLGKTQEDRDFSSRMLSIAECSEEGLFCDICYTNVNPVHESAAGFTKLDTCSHVFCDDCWRKHLRGRIKGGAVRMACPGYLCDAGVGSVTLLSFLHVTEVMTLQERIFEMNLGKTKNAKWCPNQQCGRVIQVEGQDGVELTPIDVTCTCGFKVCFVCLSEAHWPASCRQASEYKQKMIQKCKEGTREFNKTENEENLFIEIEGRICPACDKFIEKNGGCSHMACTCGFYFCWDCMRPLNTHPIGTCTPDKSILKASTQKLIIKHISAQKTSDLSKISVDGGKTEVSDRAKRSSKAKLRQRKKLIQRAQEQNEISKVSYNQEIRRLSTQLERYVLHNDQLKREVNTELIFHTNCSC